MPTNDLTRLQFLILERLLDSECCGREIREHLKSEGHRSTAAAFYQTMSRVEEAGLVEGWYETRLVDGHAVKTRWYRATGMGEAAWRDTFDFYASRQAIRQQLNGGLANA